MTRIEKATVLDDAWFLGLMFGVPLGAITISILYHVGLTPSSPLAIAILFGYSLLLYVSVDELRALKDDDRESVIADNSP